MADADPVAVLRKLYARIARKELGPVVGVQFNGIQVTDAGLLHLNFLQKLNLRSTKVTAAAITELKNASPNCKIEK